MSGHGSRRTQTTSRAPQSPNWKVIMGDDAIASAEELVRSAEAWGRYLKNLGLNTTQIRTIFGEVRRIEMSWAQGEENSEAMPDLLLLKPKLSYQAERNRPVKMLAEILIPGIDAVQSSRERFQRFVNFFEAVLAYHKAAGGQ